MAIKEKALGPDNPSVAVSLGNLASLYQDQGRFADSEPLKIRALAILEKALGPDHPSLATSLNNLAYLYDAQGRYADAEPLYKRALAINEKAFGPDHPNTAFSLGKVATVYMAQARYADAEPLLKRALSITEQALHPNMPDVDNLRNSLSLLYRFQGRYADAELLLKRSLTERETALGANHPATASVLSNLASLYRQQGRYKAAEPLFKRALAIQETTRGPDHPVVAATLNNLAGLYQDQDLIADAESAYRRSLAITERAFGPDHPNVASCLNNLATLYQDQGRNADAEPLLKRSLAIREKALGPDHSGVAESLANLATSYQLQDHHADAEPLYKRALAIKEKTFGPDHPSVASTLGNLATIYSAHGRQAEAERFFKRSLAIRENVLGPNHPDVANSLHNLANLYKDQGRYEDSEALHKRSLMIRETALGYTHRYVADSLANLALVYAAEGRFSDALPLIRANTHNGFILKSVQLPILMGAFSISLFTRTDAVNESYEVVQRATSTAASNAISKLAIRLGTGSDQLAQLIRVDQDLASENDRLDKSIVEAISKEPSKRDAAAEQAIKARLEAIAVDRARLQATLQNQFPDFAALSKPLAISVKDTQALLADGEALVVFDSDSKTYAWIITRTSADWMELEITAKELEIQVTALRSTLKTADEPFDRATAYKLYQSTFGAFADKLQSIKRISVVANGALSSLPLQLLVTEDPAGKSLKDTNWLVRSYAVTNLPSVASLKTLRGKSLASATKPMIAFADPVFSKSAKQDAKRHVAMRGLASFAVGTQIDIPALAENLEQLPSTRDEVQAIAKALQVDTSDLHFGLDATVTAVKSAKLDQYRIVYFATHGLVAGDLEKFAKGKIEPALAFSIPDKPSDVDNGLLSASEVAQLKLNADWVVLSACNTAAENKPGAEALSGLARAFFYAGARSMLVSHWEVDDEVTANLMTNIFLLIKDNPKLSHGEALQQATLAIIDRATSDEEFNPRLWAPFVVVGEPAKPN